MNTSVEFSHLTTGFVVNTNDPQQMGRIQIVCPSYGDELIEETYEQLPWARYVSPVAGTTQTIKRGPEDTDSTGPVSYGMWGIPQVGAEVLVTCIDGDKQRRVWIGCLFGQRLTHTLPHGRYIDNDGPLTSRETPIQPYSDNAKTAFESKDKFEWHTRVADYGVSGIDNVNISERIISGTNDNENHGYDKNRSQESNDVKESQVYSWTTPGFHAISMDDRADNSRMRFRTSTGHQIILDDTNERIYISTAKGENWIEMDQNGNMDVYSGRRLSVHAAEDINFTAGKTFRVYAEEGIHMHTNGEYRVNAELDVHLQSTTNIRTLSGMKTLLEAGSDINTLSGNSTLFTSGTTLEVLAGASLNMQSGAATNINAGGDIIGTGSAIHLNGPPASPALSAESSTTLSAFFANRIPEHEPWARTLTISDDSLDPELSYDSVDVGKVERGESIPRNDKWRR